MHKLDLFKLVLKSETYRKRAWVISAFSIIRENPDKWKEKTRYPSGTCLSFTKGIDIFEYAEKLAGYYLDINIAHPFREGNGRCEWEFFREYVLHLNKVLKLPDLELDYSRMNKSMMMTAVIENNINIMKQEFMKW